MIKIIYLLWLKTIFFPHITPGLKVSTLIITKNFYYYENFLRVDEGERENCKPFLEVVRSPKENQAGSFYG